MIKAIEASFEGGQVLRNGGVVEDTISIANGTIEDGPTGRRVDARGFRILPGIVDIHGDGFERHLAPRRGAMTDMRKGIASA